MAMKGVEGILWDMFTQDGGPNIYLLYAAMRTREDLGKSKARRRREEIERLTR